MRGIIHGVLLGIAIYWSLGLLAFAAREHMRFGDFSFFKEAAR